MVAINFLALAATSYEGRLTAAAGNGQGGCRRIEGGSVKGITGVRAGWGLKTCMGLSLSMFIWPATVLDNCIYVQYH